MGGLVSGLVTAPGIPVAANAGATSGATELEYSTDGIVWSALPPPALFDAPPVLVPGDALSTTVWLRNATVDPGRFSVVIRRISYDDAAFGAAVGVTGDDGAGGGMSRRALSSLGACALVIPARQLFPGESVPVTVTVDLSPGVTGASGQDGSFSFELAVGLRSDDVSGPAYGCPGEPRGIPVGPRDPVDEPDDDADDGGPDSIALTGTELLGRALLAATAMGGGGWLLVLLARRRRRRAGIDAHE